MNFLCSIRRIRMRRYWIYIALTFFSAPLLAQSNDELQKDYPFLLTDSNRIEQNPGLYRFYEKLDLLQKGEVKQVRVVHIGDSHLQADFFSGEVRRLLQLV